MASPRRPVFLLVPLLGIALIAGCENAYDESALYRLRSDRIVTAESFQQNPTQINPPGVLPIAALDRVPPEAQPPYNLGELQGASEGLLAERDKILDPKTVLSQPENAETLMRALRDIAGRPRYPKIDTGDDTLNARLENELKLDRKTLEMGSGLYRKHCLHCHGMNGDGKGPTGLWINPHPRDFRKGKFKYTSSNQDEGLRKPRRDDLKRILTQGIENSAMPAFTLMPPEEHEALISYVIHLSIRGEAEQESIRELIQDPELLSSINEAGEKSASAKRDEVFIGLVRKWAQFAAQNWLDAQEAEIKPDPSVVPQYKNEDERLAAAARGYKIFIGTGACTQCHVNFGRDADWRYDTWGTIVRPRNLTANQYGGGRRPIDLFWRLHGGIPASGMPKMPGDADPAKREEQIWDVVAFLRVLPYAEERAKLRQKHNIILD